MQQTRGIQYRSDEDNEINLTPMLDVVFIMLIFFVVTASFAREVGLDLDSPAAAQTPPDDVEVPLLVRISRNNEILLGDRLTDPRALRASLTREGSVNPGGRLVIQADPKSSNRLLVAVMDAARLAGVEDIAIAVSP